MNKPTSKIRTYRSRIVHAGHGTPGNLHTDCGTGMNSTGSRYASHYIQVADDIEITCTKCLKRQDKRDATETVETPTVTADTTGEAEYIGEWRTTAFPGQAVPVIRRTAPRTGGLPSGPLSSAAREALINIGTRRQGATVAPSVPGPVFGELLDAGFIGRGGGLTRAGSIRRELLTAELFDQMF